MNSDNCSYLQQILLLMLLFLGANLEINSCIQISAVNCSYLQLNAVNCTYLQQILLLMMLFLGANLQVNSCIQITAVNCSYLQQVLLLMLVVRPSISGLLVVLLLCRCYRDNLIVLNEF